MICGTAAARIAARLAAGSIDHTGMRAAIAAPTAAWLASIEPQPRLPLGLVYLACRSFSSRV